MLLPGTGYSSGTNSSFSAVSLNMWALIHIRVFLHKVIMFFYQFLKKMFTFTFFFLSMFGIYLYTMLQYSLFMRYVHTLYAYVI
jgi:hypothetical protein